MNKTTQQSAETLWDYLCLNEKPRSADVLIVLGSLDDRVARYAAEFTKNFVYRAVMFSGGNAHSHDLLRTTWPEPEAEHFYTEFIKAGGEARAVYIERYAQNTGQNVSLCYDLLRSEKVAIPATIETVTKPYMQRRARATFEAQWPDTTNRFFVTAPQIVFGDYPDGKGQSFERLVNIMVGDLQRIVEYPKRGLQSEQKVPRQVMSAWRRLVENGYTQHLIK